MDTHCRGRTQVPVPRSCPSSGVFQFLCIFLMPINLMPINRLAVMAKAITITQVISAPIECPHVLLDRDVKILSSTSSVRRSEHYSYNYSVSFCRLRVCAHVNIFPSLRQDASRYAVTTILTMRTFLAGSYLPIISSGQASEL